MRSGLSYFIRAVLILLIIFAAGKYYFYAVNTSQTSLSTFWTCWKNGVSLDLSVVGYSLILPILLASFYGVFPRVISIVSKVYWWVVGVIFILILAVDPFFYSYWGQKTNLGFLQFLGAENAGVSSIDRSDAVVAVAFFIIALFAYAKWLLPRLVTKRKIGILWSVLLLGVSVLILRGGWSNVPINISSAYFSKVDVENNTALNSVWSFMATELERDKHSALVFYTEDELNSIKEENNGALSYRPVYASELLNTNDSTNVVLIILESFSAKVVGSLNGNKYDATPYLDALADEGVSYSNAYASSFRSDKGLLALTYGIPSGARQTLTNFPSKISKCQSIFSHFPSYYHTSFSYGGNLEFANIKVLFNDADEVKSQSDFISTNKNVWGVHDEVVFEEFANEFLTEERPQFKMLFSLSSHEPFDVPYTRLSNPYFNSIAYTDSCLGVLLRRLKNSKKWENTLVVVTADHGTVRPDNPPLYDTSNFRIPLILVGGVVEKDTSIYTTVSQIDIKPTLAQLFSRTKSAGNSLLAPSGRAFYSFHNGITYVTDSTLNYWDIGQKRYLKVPEAPPLEKVYFQTENERFFSME